MSKQTFGEKVDRLRDRHKLEVENEKKDLEEFVRDYGAGFDCGVCGRRFLWNERFEVALDTRLFCEVCARANVGTVEFDNG